MKTKIIKGLIISLLAAGLIIGFGSCEFIVQTFTQPSGVVVDAKTGEGVAAVTVKLTYETEGKTDKEQGYVSETGYYTAITNTAGIFNWVNEIDTVPYGTYILTAEKDGYVFISKEVVIDGLAPDLGTIIGFSSSTVSDTDISLILLWDDGFDDVDAYLTFGTTGTDITTGTAPGFTDPYSAPALNYLPGFSPDTFTGDDASDDTSQERRAVYWKFPSSDNSSSATWDDSTHTNTLDKGTFDFDSDEDDTLDTYMIELDTDCSLGSGPETITIRYFPWTDQFETPNSIGEGSTGLPAETYAWVGVMEYYANAFDSDYDTAGTDDYLSENTGDSSTSAEAVLYILQGTNLLGKYTVPKYTTIKKASLVRINCFWNSADESVYQIVPDLKVLQAEDGYKSINDSNGIITVAGRKR